MAESRIPIHPKRTQTDASLRVERERADATLVTKNDAVEERADEVVRAAREVADEVVQAARHKADRTERTRTTDDDLERDQARDRADLLVDHERSLADATLDRERTLRKRYLADFLATEREATDKDLVGEREHDDTALAVRDEFLATVSHDLRSMLAALSLNADLLADQAPNGSPGDTMRRHAAKTQRVVTRMNRLVNDLLDVASIEAGKLGLLPEKVELAKILAETIESFEPIAAAKRITLHAEAEGLRSYAVLDPGRILQVLANLMSNAIKFTPPGGEVSIQIRAGKNEVHFAVRDTGIGMSEESRQKVFEKFHQIDPDRRGIGLGLHISKSIVEAHGGRMWVETKLGEGSTFSFVLPLNETA